LYNIVKLDSVLLPYSSCTLGCFERIRALGGGLLLDSGSGYPDHIDVICAAPISVAQMNANDTDPDSFYRHLRQLLGQHRATAGGHPVAPGWFGVWSYHLGQLLESVTCQQSTLPKAWMGFYPAIILIDHQRCQTHMVSLADYKDHAQRLQSAYLASLQAPADSTQPFRLTTPFEGNLPEPDYQKAFAQVQHYIERGDCYQINLAREFSAHYEGCPWQAYRVLRQQQSAPMGGYLEADDWNLISLSPERFLSVNQSNVQSKPIKGTRPRHDNPRQDLANREELLGSVKDRAENLMIVDLLRNDLGRSCSVGSVKVEKLFDIESFSNVHHLVSTVSGRLAPDLDALDLLAGAFPGGSITGAPKRRAMEIIAELEPHGRDFYCGSLMYLDVCGRLDSSILIRSLVAQAGVIRCWGGGGIVADSTCAAEYQEINDKVGKILKTIQ